MRYVNSDGKKGDIEPVCQLWVRLSMGLGLLEGIWIRHQEKMSLQASRARLLKKCRNPREVFWE